MTKRTWVNFLKMNGFIIEETGVTSKKLVFSYHVMIIILMAFLLYCKYKLHAI